MLYRRSVGTNMMTEDVVCISRSCKVFKVHAIARAYYTTLVLFFAAQLRITFCACTHVLHVLPQVCWHQPDD
jgi:hypothetical protein